jgi:uncharacterized cupredoxin-like copper-binding protein
MPIPFPAGRNAVVAAGAVAALAALASLNASFAGQMQGHDMEHQKSMTDADHASAFWFGAPGKAADVDRTIRVTANDITFDPPAMQVKAGETVRFVVTNASEVEHEFTLGDAKTQEGHRAEMAGMTDMAAGHAHDNDPNAVFVKGGETREIIWRFDKAGQIEFACNVPGHYESGMKGTIAIR